MLTATWNDPFCAYAGDGDNHWTIGLIREWWANRERLAAWIDDVRRRWSVSERGDERENALGLGDYASYLDNGLATYLREYGFWLDHRRSPARNEMLPELG